MVKIYSARKAVEFMDKLINAGVQFSLRNWGNGWIFVRKSNERLIVVK